MRPPKGEHIAYHICQFEEHILARPRFKRSPGQAPPVADGEQDRGGSLQDEVPMGMPDATQPQYEPPNVEIPFPAHTRAPSRESTDSLSDDMATVV
jgi:hypothetical protein